MLQAISLGLVVSVLNSTKSTDIPAIVSGLGPVEQVSPSPACRGNPRLAPSAATRLTHSPRAQVTLMKYLYKSMEDLSETNGNVVLGWHEKVSASSPTAWPAYSHHLSQTNMLTRAPLSHLCCQSLLQLVEAAGTGCIVRVMTDHRRV